MLIVQRKSDLGDYTLWEKQEIHRIMALSCREVRRELKDIMRGMNYSWSNIAQRLKSRLQKKVLKMEHFEPGNILYEWNVLCDEKLSWKLRGHPSFTSFDFNRDSLVKLKIIPTQAGLGAEGRKFVTRNLDVVELASLTVGDRGGFCGDDWKGDEDAIGAEEARNLHFYPEGPEFRVEYIHKRVEY